MRLAVVGSRQFRSLYIVDQWLTKLSAIRRNDSNPFVIVSGGAEGVDQYAEKWARDHGFECKVYPADWVQFGDKAGVKRNADIIGDSHALLAFWDGLSTGTLDSIKRGKSKKDYHVIVLLG